MTPRSGGLAGASEKPPDAEPPPVAKELGSRSEGGARLRTAHHWEPGGAHKCLGRSMR